MQIFLWNSKEKVWKSYYAKCLAIYQNDITKSWNVTKEIIKRAKSSERSISKRMIIDGHEIFDQEKKAKASISSL